MSPVPVAVAAAALVAAGITLLVRELTPAPPDLRAALARLDGRQVALTAQMRADTARRLGDLGVAERRLGTRLARSPPAGRCCCVRGRRTWRSSAAPQSR